MGRRGPFVCLYFLTSTTPRLKATMLDSGGGQELQDPVTRTNSSAVTELIPSPSLSSLYHRGRTTPPLCLAPSLVGPDVSFPDEAPAGVLTARRVLPGVAHSREKEEEEEEDLWDCFSAPTTPVCENDKDVCMSGVGEWAILNTASSSNGPILLLPSRASAALIKRAV